MADISVLLELDDRKYQSSLKNAERQAISFGKKFEDSLGGAAKGMDGLNSRLDNLGNLLVGAGLGAFIADLGKGAKETVNFAKVLGITTDAFMEMSVAAKRVGLDATGLTDRVSELTKKVYEAAEGNLDVRKAFTALGITFNDMIKLSPDELFNRVAEAISNIQDPATRAAMASKLLGEEGSKIDWASYVAGIEEVEGKLEGYGKSQEDAAKITQNLTEFLGLVRDEFVKLFGPITNLLAPTGGLKERMDNAALAAKVLGGALAAFGVGAAINAITTIVGGVRSMAAAFGISSAAAAISSATVAANTSATLLNANAQVFLAGAHGRLGTAVAAVAVAEANLTRLHAAGPPTVGALATATAALTAARARLATANEALAISEGHLAVATGTATTATVAAGTAATGAAAGVGTLATATTALKARLALLLPVATAVAAAVGLLYSSEVNAGEDERVEKMKEFGKELAKLDTTQLERYYDLINKNKNMTSQQAFDEVTGGNKQPEKKGTLDPDQIKAVTKAAQDRANAVKQETEAMMTQNERAQERVRLEMSLITASEATRESVLAGFDAETEKRQKVYDIINKVKALEEQITADPEKAKAEGLQSVVDAYKQQLEVVYKLTDGVQSLKEQEIQRKDAIELQNYFLDKQADGQEAIRRINEEIQDLTATEGEKRLNSVERLIQKEKELAVAKRKSQLDPGQELNMAEVTAIEAQIEQAYGGIRQKTRDLLTESRSWETGWKKAMKSYVDESTNGAKKAENVFNKAFNGMEDLLVNFAKTGKFEWKNFVAMMLEELLRAQIQAIFAGMIGDMSGAMNGAAGGAAGGGGIMGMLGGGQQQGGGGLMGMIGSLFGGGGAATGAQAGTAGATGPVTQSQGIWGTVKDVATKGWDIVTDVGGKAWDVVKDVGSGIWDTVSSIGSSVMDFFGGFFADGGSLGAGKWGIAGEAGPEIIHGPANITPMNQGQGSTNVTYNINAVDAQSFKQLVASDPGFIHAVAMAGAKGISGRR